MYEKCRETASGLRALNRGNPVMPIRCIRVSRTGKFIALEGTETRTEPYITLTHRWDSDRPTRRLEACQTTVENLRDRQNGRGFGQLPQHFFWMRFASLYT